MSRKINESLALFKSSLNTIQTALNSKLGGGITNLKLSQVADKIRQIQIKLRTATIRAIYKDSDNPGNTIITVTLYDSDGTTKLQEKTFNYTQIKYVDFEVTELKKYRVYATYKYQNSNKIANHYVEVTAFDKSFECGLYFIKADPGNPEEPSIESVDIPQTLETLEEITITEK